MSRAGFTLVELVVALVVAGVVAAAGYGVLAAAADGRAAAERAREDGIPGPAARAALEGWLRHAALWEGSGPFTGIDRRAGPLPLDELEFAVEDGGALFPGRRRVRLWVERDPTRPRRGLLAEVAPAGAAPPDRTDTLVIAAAAAGLNARYRAREAAHHYWMDAWDSARRLPDGVEVTILPAPELAAAAGGDGLPDVLRLPIAVRLRPAPREREGEP
jgi:prepilin-type N-terminal cleavage/methylation domain-containing protein